MVQQLLESRYQTDKIKHKECGIHEKKTPEHFKFKSGVTQNSVLKYILYIIISVTFKNTFMTIAVS